MTISAGTKLGPYEVTSPIGAGGMGEVYRARDERIGRDVAIKVLPDSFADNEERLRRFEQEARTAGGLNHPNLVTIYDIGRHDGAPYLVMELLEGESLREKLGSEMSGAKIPPRKAVEYASQIARGLAAAHDKGIVHRDLKPDNVFVTNDGRVKILDFGLAKQESFLADGVTDQKTAHRDTSPGSVMGTVGYMSPEQLRGRQVDQRTDIFAFGTILYEMLSGVRAFRGESTADTMSAILHRDPPDLSGEGLPIPPALDRIVHRCLDKNREERFHSAHDLALALELLSGSSLSSSSGAVLAAHKSSPGAKRMLAIVAVIAVVVGAFVLGRVLQPEGVAAGVESKRANLTQLTFLSGSETNPDISPDGDTVVYSAAGDDGGQDIFLLRVGGENPVNLTRDLKGRNIQAAFSPDGRSIAFTNVDSDVAGLYVMGATGESRRRLTDYGGDPCWTPDGKAILIATEPVFDPRVRNSTSQLRQVDLSSTEVKPLETGGQDAVQPAVTPDGKRVAFWGVPEGTGKRVIYTMSLDGSMPVAVTDDDSFNWNPKWSPDGARLFFSSSRSGAMNLWSVAIDAKTGRTSGPLEQVTVASQFNGQMSIASAGSIVFGAATVSSRLVRVPVDSRLNALGPPEVMVSGSREFWTLDVSPDQKWIAFKGFDDREDLFVASADGSGIRRLTNDRFKDRQPTWSADSESIYFYSDRSGRYEAWRIRADGSRLEQVTASPEGAIWMVRPSPDGTHVSFSVGGEVAAVGEIGGEVPISSWVTLPNPDERTALTPKAWAHDGRRFVATGLIDGTTRAGAWVCAVNSGCRRISDDGVPVAWTADDSAVVMRSTAAEPLRLVNVETLESTEGLRLPASVPDVSHNSWDVVLTLDGKWLWYVETENEQDIWMLTFEGMTNR